MKTIAMFAAIAAVCATVGAAANAKAEDPLRDVITNTMLDVGPSKPMPAVKDVPPKVSTVQVCNADLSKCHSVELKPAPKPVSKPKLTTKN